MLYDTYDIRRRYPTESIAHKNLYGNSEFIG